MKLNYLIWSLYLLLFPFYFFPPGSMQIADAFGFILIALNIRVIYLISKDRYLKILSIFILYVIFINIIWFLMLGELKILINNLYYVYCFMFLVFLKSKENSPKFWQLTYKILLLSIGLQLFIYFFNLFGLQSYGIRNKLFFNNPNQLALYAINLLVILYALTSTLKKSFKAQLLLFISLTLLVLLSNSIAGIISITLFWFLFLSKNKIKSFKYFITVLLILVFIISYKNIHITDFKVVNNMILRYQTDPENDNTLSGRGLDRIFNNSEYLILGAGEGKNDRFDSIYSGEIHATLPNILFSYGIVGLFLYLYSLFLIYRVNNKSFFILIVPFLFAFAHMTLRIPLFWISIYLVYLLNNKIYSTSKL